ncbi:MAG TPA: MBL fold metallo-hydrolase [Methylotenera sp.]|nr:MBL fold metallo-hydrolase [Methylotenera sp.]HPV45286.1 MBL fold metallo-hydrolase [Methylotenera sp.]
MQLTMLGVGSSAGTPVVGCKCVTCSSDNPRNKRTRCSSLITLDSGENILIDSGPDLRIQSLRENIERVDAVLYTHTHADHLHGIDDLRAFCQIQRAQIPLYAKEDAVAHIKQKFGYVLREPSDFWDLPVLRTEPIHGPFELFGVKVYPIPLLHGRSHILGYRIGNFAYMTDVSEIPETSFALLENLDVVLLDCLREASHPTHINIEQSLAYIGRMKAKQSYMIHMTHELEYVSLASKLPSGVFVGYDGLKLDID